MANHEDSRVQEYWDHRNAQFDRQDALDAAARHRRIEIDALRSGVGGDGWDGTRARSPVYDGPSDPGDGLWSCYKRAKDTLRQARYIDDDLRKEWLARLEAVSLFSDRAEREVRRRMNDVDWYRDNLRPFHFGYFNQSSIFLLKGELNSVAIELMLLADACQDFQQSL